ncbi:potassium channel family protein [Asanoa iriomotensis]|uniref:Potassium transporter n=1 Tax=Asanoa iriomotensis TaxID=234613 RepID=A0ABQ4C7I2_9ACTN|nr:TrkA family potassium uptake protein [Asanoa iriomotensis]GIF58730.1 potassium transporter [Asanoa iriomotensis]
MADIGGDDNVVVIGLGRFGGAVAGSLQQLGHEVLGIDIDPKLVQEWSERLTHVAEADATDEDALRQLGVPDFTHAVVGIGTHMEHSILTVLALVELGVPHIWAKAISTKHGKILASVGATKVIYPESTMGERVAHLIGSRMIDFIEFDDDFAIAKTRVPRGVVGQTLAQLGLRRKYGVTVVGVKEPGKEFAFATPDTVIPENATLIVSGKATKVEKFAATT